jgi:hypothetical protein
MTASLLVALVTMTLATYTSVRIVDLRVSSPVNIIFAIDTS